MSRAAVGIDFGTDCCSVAICNDSFTNTKDYRSDAQSNRQLLPTIIVNELGQRTTPSWVQCPATTAKTGQYVVGGTAQDQALRCGKRTVAAVKMALGHTISDPQVEKSTKKQVLVVAKLWQTHKMMAKLLAK